MHTSNKSHQRQDSESTMVLSNRKHQEILQRLPTNGNVNIPRRRPSNESMSSESSRSSTSSTELEGVGRDRSNKKPHFSQNAHHSRRRPRGASPWNGSHHYAGNQYFQQSKPRDNFISPSCFLALDCEMVGTGPGGYKSSVARVTLVDWYGRIVYDTHVQQTEEVTDYRTFVSGVTPSHLSKDNALPFKVCQRQVLNLLNNRILVGHALKNDLDCLKIEHPWWLIRDTANYTPFQQIRSQDGIPCARKLKDLTKIYLRRNIQVPGKPHNPYDDALAALQLYQLVQGEWEREMRYSIASANQVWQQQEVRRLQQQQKQHRYQHQTLVQ